jgi:hypothetical protein
MAFIFCSEKSQLSQIEDGHMREATVLCPAMFQLWLLLTYEKKSAGDIRDPMIMRVTDVLRYADTLLASCPPSTGMLPLCTSS